jgi:beta-glucosidase
LLPDEACALRIRLKYGDRRFRHGAERESAWMNSSLSPEERAELVLKQMTLDEKIALLHGNGMAHAPQWQMPLTYLSNGGAGYVEGVKRLGIPPIHF